MRIDYAMLSRYSIQSTSDQENYLDYATIAANSPSGLTPEQSAVWTYPMNHEEQVPEDALKEEVVFNMVNAMLLRVHQSGHLAKLDDARKELVKEGLDLYKKIRSDIKDFYPFWPLGLSSYADEWVSLGMRGEKKCYLAVWRREGTQESRVLPVAGLAGKEVNVRSSILLAQKTRMRGMSGPATLSVEQKKEKTARAFTNSPWS